MFRWDTGPPKWNPGHGTTKYSSGTRDSGLPKWDKGPRTPKYLSETRDIQFSIVLIVTSLVTKLWINLFIWWTYFMANIQKQPLRWIISSYINFSEILGKKNCEGVPIYLVKLKILKTEKKSRIDYQCIMWGINKLLFYSAIFSY